jgi:UDP-N-acetyl-D-glucosamine dehydrogenase
MGTQLKEKIEARTARIAIIGLGYVGLPLALLISELEFPVTGFDVDDRKVKSLSAGESYIYHIPATEIQGAMKHGFSATTDYSKLSKMDAVIICVPTPLDEHREPDLSYIVKTAESMMPHIRTGQLIILESTTYPGTTEEVLVPILEKNPSGVKVARKGKSGSKDIFVAFSPERENPGDNSIARRDIPKVVGGMEPVATTLASALYNAIFNRTVPVSAPAAAEMSKLLENIYRCVNIALVNELKQLCLRMGIDIWEVIAAASTKPFGFHPFYPGPGLGGHCIPIDPFYLSWKARQYDFQTRFIELAGEVNSAMPYHVVNAIGRALNRERKAMNGSRILVLGVAYKKDVDDLRESPALTIIELLQEEGCEVAYYDPYFPMVTEGRHYKLHMQRSPLENLQQYDCAVIVTDHSAVDYSHIVRECRLVVDTRNATRGISAANVVHC